LAKLNTNELEEFLVNLLQKSY